MWGTRKLAVKKYGLQGFIHGRIFFSGKAAFAGKTQLIAEGSKHNNSCIIRNPCLVMLNPKTMANIDSLGIGPQTLKYNKRVFYRVDHLLEWMEQRDKAPEVGTSDVSAVVAIGQARPVAAAIARCV